MRREVAREKNKRGDALVNMPVPFIEARETSFLNSLKVAIGRDGGRDGVGDPRASWPEKRRLAQAMFETQGGAETKKNGTSHDVITTRRFSLVCVDDAKAGCLN